MTTADVASEGTEPRAGTIELHYRGRTVQALVTGPQDGGRAVGVEDAIEALRGAPACAVDAAALQVVVARPTGRALTIGEIEAPDQAGDRRFVAVAVNGMAAYAVPPIAPTAEPAGPNLPHNSRNDGGQGATATDAAAAAPVAAAAIREQLATLGVTHGILDQTLARFEPAADLDEVICVARGQAPTPGEDGGISFGFEMSPQTTRTERDDGSVDFHEATAAQFVEAGRTLATRRPPLGGQPGPRDGTAAAERAGLRPGEHRRTNTEIRGDTLVATQTGRPLMNGGRVEVVQVFEVAGDLDYAVGNIDFSGDVVVRGDVKPDFRITAGGAVVVLGVTEKASITAGGDITLGGVIGRGGTVLNAGSDLVARYLLVC